MKRFQRVFAFLQYSTCCHRCARSSNLKGFSRSLVKLVHFYSLLFEFTFTCFKKYNFLPFYLWKMIIRWWMKMSINFLTKDSTAHSLLNFRLWWISVMVFHRNQLSSPPRLVVKHSPNVKSERKPRSWRNFTRLTLTVEVVHQLSETTEQKDSVSFEEMKCFNPSDTLQKVPAATKKKLLQSFCSKQTNQKNNF